MGKDATLSFICIYEWDAAMSDEEIVSWYKLTGMAPFCLCFTSIGDATQMLKELNEKYPMPATMRRLVVVESVSFPAEGQ